MTFQKIFPARILTQNNLKNWVSTRFWKFVTARARNRIASVWFGSDRFELNRNEPEPKQPGSIRALVSALVRITETHSYSVLW
jgi:hypothetical protein